MTWKRHPIAKAVEPQRLQAVANAEASAKKIVLEKAGSLRKADGDLEIACPPPSFNDSDIEYSSKRFQRRLFERLVITDPNRRNNYVPKRTYYVVIDPNKCGRFIEEARENANEQYDKFIQKLIRKVGEVREATCQGSHVWGHSILTVTKTDGSVERWKTRMIVNVSKNGKFFNQFPTRKIK